MKQVITCPRRHDVRVPATFPPLVHSNYSFSSANSRLCRRMSLPRTANSPEQSNEMHCVLLCQMVFGQRLRRFGSVLWMEMARNVNAER